MRSTAEWEKALEGTSEGCWEVGSNGTEVYHVDEMGRGVVADTGSHIEKMWPDDDSGALAGARADARLIALSREAVAEVVRLRCELELRVRIWQKVAEKLENRGDKDGASQARHTVAVVTRILEDTHE